MSTIKTIYFYPDMFTGLKWADLCWKKKTYVFVLIFDWWCRCCDVFRLSSKINFECDVFFQNFCREFLWSSTGNSSRVPSRIIRRLLREFLSSFTGNFFGFPSWIFQEFFQSFFRNSLDFLQIPRSSTRISFGDPPGFSLELLQDFLHSYFWNIFEVCLKLFRSSSSTCFGVPAGSPLEALQKFLQSYSWHFCGVLHEISLEFLQELLQISSWILFGTPRGIPSIVPPGFFFWISTGIRQSSSSTSLEILRSSTSNTPGVNSEKSLHFLRKILQSSSWIFSWVSPTIPLDLKYLPRSSSRHASRVLPETQTEFL